MVVLLELELEHLGRPEGGAFSLVLPGVQVQWSLSISPMHINFSHFSPGMFIWPKISTWPKHPPSRKRLKWKVNKRILPVWLSSILRATLELLGEASGLISLVLVFNPPWLVSISRFGIFKWRLGAGLSLLSPAVFGLDSLLWTFWEKSASITKTTSLKKLPLPIILWQLAIKNLTCFFASFQSFGSSLWLLDRT